MRRRALAPIALVVALAACGGDDDAGSDATEPAASSVPGSVTDMSLVPVTTVPVSVPDVELPESIPTELVITEITPGSGPAAAAGDTVYVNYVGVRSEDGEQFDTSFGGDPFPVTLGSGGVIAGWDQGLIGATAGERLQLDIPADLAYGDSPPPQSEVIQAGDALTFVIDVLAVVPPTDPADEPTDIPTSSELVTAVETEDVVVGEGEPLQPGQTALVHVVAARGDDGSVLQSTWVDGAPQAVTIPEGELSEEVAALVGMQVGGRRAITLPPDPNLGLTPETNVVIIADLVGTF